MKKLTIAIISLFLCSCSHGMQGFNNASFPLIATNLNGTLVSTSGAGLMVLGSEYGAVMNPQGQVTTTFPIFQLLNGR